MREIKKTHAFISSREGNFSTLVVCSADFVWGGSFLHRVKFYSLMFMHKIFTQIAGVNGKQPWYFLVKSLLILDIWFSDSNCERKSRWSWRHGRVSQYQ